MRHLHLEFVCASLSLGLAVFLLGMSGWQLLLFVDGARGIFLPLWMTMTLSVVVSLTLFRHAAEGIRQEIHQPKRSHGA